MKSAAVAVLIFAAGYCQAGHCQAGHCQEEPPAFDVASVRPNRISAAGGEGSTREKLESSPGRLTMSNVTLRSCIKWAYSVRDYQIALQSGSSLGWIQKERYDIAATSATPVSTSQQRLMLQTLLASRFQLTLHKEETPLPVYAMLVAKNGPKLTRSQGEGQSAMRIAGGSFVFRYYSMPEFGEQLTVLPFRLDRPVVDKTGLDGAFDFALKIAGSDSEMKHTMEGQVEGPSIFSLLGDLGLRLEPQKVPAEVLVIEKAERTPTEN